jgi:hypothetical protein
MEKQSFLMGKSTISMENPYFLMGKSTISMENPCFSNEYLNINYGSMVILIVAKC